MVESWVVYVVIVVVVVGVGGPVAWLIYRHIQLLRLLRERRDYGTAEDIALESQSRRGGLEPHQYNTSVATPHGTLHSPSPSPRMRVGGEERILAITQQDNSHGSDVGQDGRRSATTLITIHQHNDDEGGNDNNSEEDEGDAQRVSGNASYVLQPRPDSPTELLGVAIENRIRPRHRLPKGTVVVQHADQQVIIDFSQLHDIPTAAPPPLSAEELQKLEEQRNRIASPELYGRAEYLHRSFAASSSFGSAHHASQLQQQSQQSAGRGAGSRPGSHTATPIRSLRQLTAAELAQLVDGYGYGSPHGSTASLASRSYRPGSLAGNSVRDADRPLRPLFLPQSALVQIPSQPQQQQNQKSASPSSHASQRREGARRAGTRSSSHTDTARYSPQAGGNGNGSSSSDLASRSPTHNNNNNHNNHSGSSSGIMMDEGRAGRRKTASQRNSQQQQQQRRRQRNGRQSYLYDLESTSDDFDEADAVERMREWEQAAQPSAAAAKARRRPTSRQDNNCNNNTQEEQQQGSKATGEAPPGGAQASPTQPVEEEGRRRREKADELQTGNNSHANSNGATVGQCSEAASHSPMQRPEQAIATTTTTTAADASHVGQG